MPPFQPEDIDDHAIVCCGFTERTSLNKRNGVLKDGKPGRLYRLRDASSTKRSQFHGTSPEGRCRKCHHRHTVDYNGPKHPHAWECQQRQALAARMD